MAGDGDAPGVGPGGRGAVVLSRHRDAGVLRLFEQSMVLVRTGAVDGGIAATGAAGYGVFSRRGYRYRRTFHEFRNPERRTPAGYQPGRGLDRPARLVAADGVRQPDTAGAGGRHRSGPRHVRFAARRRNGDADEHAGVVGIGCGDGMGGPPGATLSNIDRDVPTMGVAARLSGAADRRPRFFPGQSTVLGRAADRRRLVHARDAAGGDGALLRDGRGDR